MEHFEPGSFVFRRTPGQYSPSTIRMALPADAPLDELISVFTDFLRACGYHVPEDGELDWVSTDAGLEAAYSEAEDWAQR